MLTRLALRNFKSFVDEAVTVAPFTLLIGANASGKSNFLDAIRFLKGLALFYPLDDILGGRYEGGTQIWPGIRGGAAEIANDPAQRIEMAAELTGAAEPFVYDMAFRVAPELSIEQSRLSRPVGELVLVDSRPRSNVQPVVRAQIGVPALAGAQFLDLQPNRMRDFRPKQYRSLGLDGANVSPALAQLCANPDTRQTVVDWISELCAPEITGIDFIETPQLNETMFQLVEENGRRISARSVSDGTLRFLGQLVALLTAPPGSILLIEELENGLHPSRQHLLVEAIQGQVEARGIQVIATTHSPSLLDAVDTATLEQAILFARNPEGQGTVMRNLGQLPHFAEVLERRQMSELFTTQWPERAL